MYWIGNWIGSYPRWYFISRHWYDGKPKYWDLKLDLGISEVMHMFKDVKTGVSMYWIGNWIRSYPLCYFISRYWYHGRPQYWDLEMDWGIYEIMHMFKDVETRFSMYWIGNWIGSYPMHYFTSRYWYDMIWYHMIRYASLSIGIWNWIGVYLRSCLSSKMSKLFFLWIVMVNPGHISFADIFGSLSLHWYIFRFDKTDAILYIIVHQRGLS